MKKIISIVGLFVGVNHEVKFNLMLGYFMIGTSNVLYLDCLVDLLGSMK